jgi:hypothetical protein
LTDLTKLQPAQHHTAEQHAEEAKKRAEKARRDFIAFEQVELEAAKAKDVQAAVAAERQGKPAPAKRTHTIAAESKLKELEFEVDKTGELHKAALADLRAADDEYGSAYLSNAEKAREAALVAFHDAVEKLIPLHADLIQLGSLLRSRGGECPGAGAITVRPKMIDGLEIVREHQQLTGALSVADVFTGLAKVGLPPEEQREYKINPFTGERIVGPPAESIEAAAKHAQLVAKAHNDQSPGGVDQEIAERQRFNEWVEAGKPSQ